MLVGKGGWARFGKNEPKHHFWIVIADAGDKVLVVNLTTVHNKPHEDYACVFNAGEYPKVTKKSYIAYAEARLKNKETVRSKKSLRVIDKQMFARVIAGAKKSKYFLFDDLL